MYYFDVLICNRLVDLLKNRPTYMYMSLSIIETIVK